MAVSSMAAAGHRSCETATPTVAPPVARIARAPPTGAPPVPSIAGPRQAVGAGAETAAASKKVPEIRACRRRNRTTALRSRLCQYASPALVTPSVDHMIDAPRRNQHRIEAQREIASLRETGEQEARGAQQAPALVRRHRLAGGRDLAARLDLDHGQNLAAARPDVDLVLGGAQIPPE